MELAIKKKGAGSNAETSPAVEKDKETSNGGAAAVVEVSSREGLRPRKKTSKNK